MKTVLIVFAVLTLVTILTVACQHSADEFSKQSKCVLAGDGCNGERGAQGATGLAGSAGPAGLDGQPARVITLCPGVTAYPGIFVETALCINNRLYGVYSSNGGFLTELPPGVYSSATIGSACTVTIASNCQVVN